MTASEESPVAVIGAGGSGLVTARALRRSGVPFELLEARDGVGGTWRYDPSGDGSACYEALVANTSKLRMSLRGRRIPGRPWEYARHAEMLAYFERLADEEDLRRSLRLGWRVSSARRENGGWVLTSTAGEERSYRAIVSALGVNGRPRFTPVAGFEGEQIHSAEYRTPDRFAGRDVLVMGLGTSGMEIAGAVADVARSTHVSVRSPLWLMTRRLWGFPLDWFADPLTGRIYPWSVRRWFVKQFCTLTTGRLHKLGVPRPTRRCGDDILAISDTFPRAVRAGLVEFHPAVSGADGRRVAFSDGSAVDADVIVHATGFEPPVDFLPAGARPDGRGLYRGIVHPDHPDLLFVGLFEAQRALLPIAEDQAAWAADVLSGRLPLPPGDALRRGAAEAAEARQRDFGDRHVFMVEYGRYGPSLRRERRAAQTA